MTDCIWEHEIEKNVNDFSYFYFILFFIWAIGDVLGIHNLNKELNRVCGDEEEKLWDGEDEGYSSPRSECEGSGDHPR